MYAAIDPVTSYIVEALHVDKVGRAHLGDNQNNANIRGLVKKL